MPIISVTRLRLRSWRFLPKFFWYAIPSNVQVRKAPGNLGIDMLNDARLVFWTKTAWTDESAMKAYMLSGAHRRAMPTLMGMCDEAAVTHWTQQDATLPSWEEAHRRLRAEGRRSKVHHPSADHIALHITPPRG